MVGQSTPSKKSPTSTPHQPHQPPIYYAANPASPTSPTSPSSRLSLHRTNSQHVHNADVNGVDSEFGIHSNSRHEDDPEGQPRLSRSRSGGGGQSQNKRASTQSVSQRIKRQSLAQELKEWEEADAALRQKEQKELEEVRNGGDGSRAEREYEREYEEVIIIEEEVDQHQDQDESSKKFDSSAPASTRASTIRSTDLEDHAMGEKTQSSLDLGHHGPDLHLEKESEKDPNLVTWDSEDDPANPRNWSMHRKWAVTFIVSSYTFMSPLSSSMIAPALPIISQQFNITNSAIQSLILSVFVLAYAFGPLLLAPLSELYGRKIVLTASNIFFIIFTVACAVAQTKEQLAVFRFFAGFGGSAPLTIGGGAISDLFTPDQRGGAMAIYSLAPLMGPVIGPIMGAWITQCTGKWRWIFGATCIAMGVVAIGGFILLPETYQPRILAVKAAKLRKETGNENLKTAFERDNTESFWIRLRHNLIRPFVLLGTQPVVQAFAIIMAFLYGTMYLLLTTFDAVFKEVYNESVGIASLNYISLGLGFALGGQIGGRGVDYVYRRLKAKNDGVGLPEFKLPFMMCTTWMLPAGMLIYGWSAEYKVHWIVPNIGSAIFGGGMLFAFLAIQNYMVDCFSLYAASALSAVTFLRSLAGFGFPLFAPAMYNALGYGWGNSVIALVALVVGIPAPIIMYRYGPHLRSKSSYAIHTTLKKP